MSILHRLKSFIARDKVARQRGEQDGPADIAQAGSRDTGGGPISDTMDRNSTTGTSESGEFVGRVGGDETGDVGLSGGEARTGHRADGRTGAARDE
jgi:hypothetical protein